MASYITQAMIRAEQEAQRDAQAEERADDASNSIEWLIFVEMQGEGVSD